MWKEEDTWLVGRKLFLVKSMLPTFCAFYHICLLLLNYLKTQKEPGIDHIFFDRHLKGICEFRFQNTVTTVGNFQNRFLILQSSSFGFCFCVIMVCCLFEVEKKEKWKILLLSNVLIFCLPHLLIFWKRKWKVSFSFTEVFFFYYLNKI